AYIRRFIDGKRFFSPLPGDPQSSSASLLYYPSEDDDLGFDSVAEYEAWLKKTGRHKEGAPKIILTGQMGVADSLVATLEKKGFTVYPVSMIQRFVAGEHADSVGASALINMAHGRMGDEIVSWLSDKNIPLFSPLNVNRPYDEWMADRMGMNGGFLSKSVVTPEIDGALLPYSLFAHFDGPDGLPVVDAIPDRLERFTETVANYISLRSKPNSEKRLAVFYFKGPGQSALVAEGMEVAPSLYNFLLRLKAEGYKVENLPPDAASLEKLINAHGRLFNGYAAGAMADFVKSSHPQLISREEYDSWRRHSLSPKMIAETDSVDGPFPGHGLSDGEGNLALARLSFGNIVLIPQPAAGLGDDDFRIVHGTDAAPPHQYAAAYLWAKHGFGADAIAHFGAHGSLEFTPRKQVALGSEDWPDRLVGTMPHFYLYSTSNVGEAMIAKRRSYAGIINYLTPPFLESDVRGIYKNLADAVNAYNASKTTADSLRNASLVRKHTLELGIHRELRIDSVSPFTADDILRIENFAEELANEKITGALYVLGRPYSQDHIASTVEAMTIDPIAYSLQKLCGGDLRQLRQKARSLVSSGAEINDEALCRIAGITRQELDSARAINE
ncbi:MAG: cobaltochelatase subunit CobN, partial [Muribaculaceae bacterium]|nr:cobaltochelatase subunit CobN [Muribaculaceae bacterium]